MSNAIKLNRFGKLLLSEAVSPNTELSFQEKHSVPESENFPFVFNDHVCLILAPSPTAVTPIFTMADFY